MRTYAEVSHALARPHPQRGRPLSGDFQAAGVCFGVFGKGP